MRGNASTKVILPYVSGLWLPLVRDLHYDAAGPAEERPGHLGRMNAVRLSDGAEFPEFEVPPDGVLPLRDGPAYATAPYSNYGEAGTSDTVASRFLKRGLRGARGELTRVLAERMPG